MTTYAEIRSYFTTMKRGEDTIWVRKDDAPEWINDFCMEAHGTDMFPDDWRYEIIVEALDFLIDNDIDPDDSDMAHAFADDVDVYTSDLFEWAGSHLNRQGYVDQAMEEGLVEADTPLDRRLMVGQYMERLEIFNNVVEAAREYVEEDEEDENEEVDA